MPIVRVSMPVYVPASLRGPLRGLRRRLDPSLPRNLLGDRDVEWSFVAAHMPAGPGEALDFGSGRSYMGLLAARRGFNVTAIDLEPQTFPWRHPNFQFVQGDFLGTEWGLRRFDLVINCSTVEHVGLPGRFGVRTGATDGDLEAMARLRVLMKPGGAMLLTVPVGRDACFPPLCRVYGERRLPMLLAGYGVSCEEFWVKDGANRWTPCSRETAVTFEADCRSWNPLRNVYGLGLFVLRV